MAKHLGDPYRYRLPETVDVDISKGQKERLEAAGFAFNESTQSMERYREEWAERVLVDVTYEVEVPAEVPTHEYEVQAVDDKVYRVSYYEARPSGFFGFFKKLLHIRNKEEDVSDSRFDELLELQAEGKVSGLEKTITPKLVKRKVEMTEKEFMAYLEGGKSAKLVRKNAGTKVENVTRTGEATVKLEDFAEFAEGKRIVEEERRTEKYLKDKVLVDIRRPIETTIKFYQPGVWSHGRNHMEGSHAEFEATVRIRYMSGESPFDPDFFDRDGIAAGVETLIERYHPSAEHIRKRTDGRNGYEIEKQHISA